ncbi:N-formylglutamate amidohydrolase [Lutimonas sp.]|uniref:N-formylglutamate amidohydrolase n=1 Tax=Lutimonas sp. TaxID=1872403 RepID=UPI003D9B4624
MQKLSIEQIIKNINAGITFDAVADDYSFTLKIDRYAHYVCAAVHDGHQFRQELWDNCLHSAYERWYEDDPATKEMVADQPIVIAGIDSRFEYDLNRAPELAIYEDAWGKELWKKPLSDEMKNKSLAKHTAFYKVVFALIHKLESIHEKCIVYDMHSYNWKRWPREVPTWNLGTTNIDQKRFEKDIEAWRQSLSEIKLPDGIKSTAAVNDTFYGNGYFLKFISSSFENTLVLATEIAKVYCDENKQVLFPEVIACIKQELQNRIPKHAGSFSKAS